MKYLQIQGGKKLDGTISVHGAKNGVLPLLSACILVDGITVLHNCPRLSDVEVTVNILRYLGARVTRNDDTLIVDASNIIRNNILEEYMKELRSSIIFLGALASRTGDACLYLPGGCEIGLRPIDLHLKGLKALGYRVYTDGHNVCASKNNVKGAEIVLPFPSVGATENIILASVLTPGTTTIVNAAREPEIADLVLFLNKAGAKISGISTPTIVVEGVKSLHSTEHTVIPDRILATTLMSACAVTGGSIELNDLRVEHIMPTIPVFDEMGCTVMTGKNSVFIKAPPRLKRVKKIETMAYPGFPTDCQAPVMAALSVAKGTSIIKETIFENRYKHTEQLNLFGTDISVNDRIAVVNGVKNIHSADVRCTDLRGGAAVVIAALKAEGTSTVRDIYHIDRGYECIENQLSTLGADVKRLYDEKE
ncbi:UDP-N-acetylglucosamine 1-carboxyvinyltransferase [uncultured Eubacterium sp.]|uniref:UDP-N-acetylglucosamine 1-carboxyvinyltransferase n=1 Tax=uncultured Eubacterium sp. TaxID=165185 RepID=UPI00262C91A1|nr:UDP-N-acetylglucosamine 1-carboxyvinyltransferase [uncultured Eubacterium sp.]